MMKPLSLFIGWRHTRAKKRNHFVSFISLASMLGIALGVTVLITVLSVMNGFDFQVRSRFFAVAPQVSVYAPYQAVWENQWHHLVQTVKRNPQVVQSAPFTSGKGMLLSGTQIQALQVMGIIPKQEVKVSQISKKLVQGKLSSLQPKQFHIIIGKTLSDRLGLNVGDKVNLFTPRSSVTLAGIFPVYRQFTISAIFHTKGGFALDNLVAYINMQDAQSLFGKHQSLNGLHLKLKDVYLANQVSSEIMNNLPPGYVVSNWTDAFGPFSQALDMEKMILFIILLLIVAVAAFNLVSTLVMIVTDKQADIAILRTLGASPGMIMRSFIWQGLIVGVVGTLLGMLGGVLLSWNVTQIANWIQRVFHVQLISQKVYLLNFLPSRLSWFDVFSVCGMAFVLSLLATIYPAWLAFKTQPAEALRYE